MFVFIGLSPPLLIFFFFFNDTAPTEIYTLSLHDALPIGFLRPRSGPRTTLSRLANLGKRHRRLVRLVRRWAPVRVQRTVSGLTQFAGAVDWPATTAFGVHLFHPFFGVEVNVLGREPQGSVVPSDLS